MGKPRKSSQWLIQLLIIYSCLSLDNAKATDDFSTSEEFILIFTGEVVIGITSLTFAVGNFNCVLKEERPSAFWRYGGWVTGGLNIVAGISWLVYSEREWEGRAWWLGTTHLVLGAMDIGFTLWASSQPEQSPTTKRPKWISLSPIIIPDSVGGVSLAIGLRLNNW